MNTEVVVALTGGATSVAAALFAWIQSARAARLSSETNLALENLRSDAALELERVRRDSATALETMRLQSERRAKAYEQAREECEPLEAKLSRAWQLLQIVKDELLRLPPALGQRDDFGDACKQILTAARDFNALYRESGAKMPDPSILHAARHRMVNTLECLDLWYHESHGALPMRFVAAEHSNLPLPSLWVEEESLAEMVQENRQELTECQQQILRAKSQLRQMMADRIFAALHQPNMDKSPD